MDLVLPELTGIDATSRILAALPLTRIVILSACDTSEHVFRACARALAATSEGMRFAEARPGSPRRGRRRTILSPRITNVLIDSLLGDAEPVSPLESLSPREREVLHLTVSGASSAEIGMKLSLSRKTWTPIEAA